MSLFDLGAELPITLAMFVKDEEDNVRDVIESVKSIISEIVIIDTGSTDQTIEICKKLTHAVYSMGFNDFGSIRTMTAQLARQPWVLMLDADERIAPEDLDKFAALIDQNGGVKGDNMELDEDGEVITDSWAFPRKRWADKYMRKQVELDAFPDWQVRLFRNDRRIHFVRRIHERISGCIKTAHVDVDEGPTIHHFQNVNKTVEDLKVRHNLYQKLYNLDIADGVEHAEPVIADIDKEAIS